jgi:hypothetical protein
MRKLKGKTACSERQGAEETAKLHAGRGPDGMVKARLLEPQYPLHKQAWIGYGGKHPRLP